MSNLLYINSNEELILEVLNFNYNAGAEKYHDKITWEMFVARGEIFEIGNGKCIRYKVSEEFENMRVAFVAYINERDKNRYPTQRIECFVVRPAPKNLRVLRVEQTQGARDVVVGETIKLRVTEFYPEGSEPTVYEKDTIKWDIIVGDAERKVFVVNNEPLLSDRIDFAVPAEWAGKEVVIMPYFHSPSPSSERSVRLKVAGWEFPLLVAESNRQPGKEADGTIARDMHSGDMTRMAILTKFWDRIVRHPKILAVNAIAFGNANIHFTHFKAMVRLLFSQNNIDLYQPVFPEDLSRNCFIQRGIPIFDENRQRTIQMRSTVRVHLANNAMAMIDHFRYGRGENYSNHFLTTAVMSHQNTINFFNAIRQEFAKAISENDGNLNSFNDKEGRLRQFRRPVFNTWADRFQGLTIALNDTWAYKVWITEYELKADGTYRGRMKITIYDHFGLDDDDVSFRRVARHISGFYHWFTLQRWRGFNREFKPFITVIEKELPFRGRL